MTERLMLAHGLPRFGVRPAHARKRPDQSNWVGPPVHSGFFHFSWGAYCHDGPINWDAFAQWLAFLHNGEEMEKKKSQILWARFGSCGEESWDDGSSLNSELCLVQFRLVSTHDSCWNNGLASRQKWTMKGSFSSWLVENSPRDPYQWNFKLELSKQSGLYPSLNKSDKSNPCHHYLIPNRRSENSTTEITPNHQPTYQFFFLISWMILWIW